MLLWMMSLLLSVFLGMGAVAFITLLERKVLGLSQVRLGPNKLTITGVLQPVADGVKLLAKEMLFILKSQTMLFCLSPFVLLVLFCSIWSFAVSWEGSMLSHQNSALFFFSMLGLGAYGVILSGWNVMSSFSKMGGLRGILQSLSYEVALILLFIVVLMAFTTFAMKGDKVEFLLYLVWLILWGLVSAMETNRAPFDLLEGESELISGFNIEMGSILFVYLFLSEYGMIILFSLITSCCLMINENIFALIFSLVILMMRSCYPRIRYDSLMGVMWQGILPMSLLIFSTSLIL